MASFRFSRDSYTLNKYKTASTVFFVADIYISQTFIIHRFPFLWLPICGQSIKVYRTIGGDRSIPSEEKRNLKNLMKNQNNFEIKGLHMEKLGSMC